MELNWIDVNPLSFNSLLLLERVQLSWLPDWLNENELAIALQANPVVEWYFRHKCPEISPWVDRVLQCLQDIPTFDLERIRLAELEIMRQINDLLVYAIDPTLYDAQPFLGWDSDELRKLTDFTGKTVIDIGSGTGRLALVAAEHAWAVFAVEPVSNLRCYIKEKAHQQGYPNIYPVDGLITDLPFPEGFSDVTLSGHVFGDHPAEEYAEMVRVTRLGGIIILCPGSAFHEENAHTFLLEQFFDWSIIDEPCDGPKHKYWKMVAGK
jgi:hypothetical protein